MVIVEAIGAAANQLRMRDAAVPKSKRAHRLVIYQNRLDPHIFREILADALKLHPTEAMRLVSHTPGVIPFALTRLRARRVAKTLASVGVEVGVWPVQRLPNLSQPCLVHKMDCRADGLATVGLRGEPLHWVPWDLIELVSVGAFAGESKELTLFGPTWLSASAGALRSLVAGYHRSGTHVPKVVRTSRPELWIVRRRPVQAIRILHDRANYEYLGDRRAPSARANFRLLIDDVLRLAPHATRTPATQSFLVYDRPGQHCFGSAQQFMEYTAWQLVVRWREQRRGNRDAGDETSNTPQA